MQDLYYSKKLDQYFPTRVDYLLYALQIISDDLATLRWRTKGIQKAPAIIRTRGHRLARRANDRRHAGTRGPERHTG